MIVDEVIWEIINNEHCSFKSKLETNVFCRNEHNVTGLCNRNSCPLANSRYATVIEEKGACYLYIKTAERAHTPKDLWEKIKLDKSYNKALEQIDEQLQYWPEFLKHKCKQRFTRYRQVLVKKRQMKLKGTEILEVVSRKAEKREKSRGKKAIKAALIENHIEEELLNRLKEGKYNEFMNINQEKFNSLLENKGTEMEEDYYVDHDLDLLDEEIDNVFVSDFNNKDNIDDIDYLNDSLDDNTNNLNKTDYTESNDTDNLNNVKSNKALSKKGKMLNNKRKKLNIEYETNTSQNILETNLA